MKLRAVFSELNLQVVYLARVLRLIWGASRRYTLAWGFVLALQGLMPAATVLLIRELVNRLVDVLGIGATWENLAPLLTIGGLLAATMLLTEMLASIADWVRTAQAELVQDYMSALVHEKAVTVDLAYYENPDYHDRLERARSDASGRSLALLENGGGLLQNAITLVAMGSLLIPLGWWLPFVLFFSTLPVFFVIVRFHKRYHRWWVQTIPQRRRAKYYEWMLTFSDMAAEFRLFNLGRHFKEGYQRIRGEMRSEQLALSRSQTFARMGAGLLALLITGGTMLWMGWRALLGAVSLGDLVLFYQAFSRGQALVRSVMGNVGGIYSNSLFLKDLFEYLEVQPQLVDPPNPVPAPAPLRQGIAFKGVTFQYPHSERKALDNFSVTVPAGSIVAFVGANGAGKSTLVKLLCRLYDPTSGAIELDGVDLRHMAMDDLRSRLSVLFQFPIPYQDTAAQNIALGELARSPSMAEVEAAARAAGVHEMISRLPQGYDTVQGKWFSTGAELSGGEWQRIALARAFIRQSPILILDEPTSFMDSWSETEWLERFSAFAEGRTSILITHRFTTAMRADMIHVMGEGRILESGTHQQLVSKGGLYAESWRAQMQSRGSDNPEGSPEMAGAVALRGVNKNGPAS